MPKHNVSIVKARKTQNNDVMNIHTTIENLDPILHTTTINPMNEMVGVIDVIPCKVQHKKYLDITFSSN